MKRIIGAVGVGDQTFTAGQEAEMEAAAEKATKAGKANIDWDRLEAAGVVQGYGKVKKEEEGGEEAPAPRAPAAKKSTKKGR